MKSIKLTSMILVVLFIIACAESWGMVWKILVAVAAFFELIQIIVLVASRNK
jgi:hypothetical protein